MGKGEIPLPSRGDDPISLLGRFSAKEQGSAAGSRVPLIISEFSNRNSVSMSDKGKDRNSEGSPTTGVVVRSKPKTRKPSMYKVIMLNDDYTPMEFVVMVLEKIFNKSHEEAVKIMLHVHQKGVGVCGVYTYEVAETKVTQVMDLAQQQQYQHPLQCTLEKE